MIEATMADLRKSISFFSSNEIIHIVNGRKKEEVGFFVPSVFRDEFKNFVDSIENRKKLKLLKRISLAQEQDPIGDGALSDGIE